VVNSVEVEEDVEEEAAECVKTTLGKRLAQLDSPKNQLQTKKSSNLTKSNGTS
jgi:hypothetical protein